MISGKCVGLDHGLGNYPIAPAKTMYAANASFPAYSCESCTHPSVLFLAGQLSANSWNSPFG